MQCLRNEADINLHLQDLALDNIVNLIEKGFEKLLKIDLFWLLYLIY